MTDLPPPRPSAIPAPAADPPSSLEASSVRCVLAVLQADHAITGKEIRDRSGLPRRTVYSALCVLRRRGLLQQRPSLRDTRQTLFWLAGGVGADSAASAAAAGLGAPALSAAPAAPA